MESAIAIVWNTHLLASAAIPEMFRAVTVPGRGIYWDGLFSQNPPIDDLIDKQIDELWIIQINSSTCTSVPKETHEISVSPLGRTPSAGTRRTRPAPSVDGQGDRFSDGDGDPVEAAEGAVGALELAWPSRKGRSLS